MNGVHGDASSDDVHANAVLYALNALEPEERAAFEPHLHRCPACRQEVAQFQEIGVHLAEAVAQDPPQELRHNVLASVQETRSQSEARPDAQVVSLADRRRPRAPWLAAAAAAVLVPGAALGGWVLGTHAEEREQQQLAAQQQERQNRLLAAPDVATHQLEVDGRPATLVVSEEQDAAMFIAADLPAPGADREYQLWLMQDGAPVPDVHFSGGQVEVWLDGDVGRAGAVAMTVEPAGGSEAPTSPVMTSTEI